MSAPVAHYIPKPLDLVRLEHQISLAISQQSPEVTP